MPLRYRAPMQIYYETDGQVVAQAWEPGMPIPDQTIWIDLLHPKKEQEAAVESYLGTSIPTHEEMVEIELSNRLYQEGDAIFMTATMVTKANASTPETHAVTFIVTNHVLVTVRYVDSTSFKRFATHLLKQPAGHHDGSTLLLELLNSIINRIADILERVDRDIDRITKDIFKHHAAESKDEVVSYQQVLKRIGRCGDLASKTHESLVTLGRVTEFSAHHKKMTLPENETLLAAIRKDITGLTDHGSYLTGKVNFLLDATLGMISIEQNGTIKIFSVASVVFLPPTLLASIYGMNFKLMPELDWQVGYPMAIFFMILSAILPYAYFKRRKWL